MRLSNHSIPSGDCAAASGLALRIAPASKAPSRAIPRGLEASKGTSYQRYRRTRFFAARAADENHSVPHLHSERTRNGNQGNPSSCKKPPALFPRLQTAMGNAEG